MTPTVAQIIKVLEGAYPVNLAEDWDKNGLIVGDPKQPVTHALVALDPVQAVVDQAIELGAELIITHHPLLLHGINFLPHTTPKGKLISDLHRHNISLYNCHTNADAAPGGVADALAELFGLTKTTALIPVPIPAELKNRSLQSQLNQDNQSQKAAPTEPSANSSIATTGNQDVCGLGRVGLLPHPMTLRAFAKQVAQALPASPAGLLVGGNLDDQVQKIAVSGGAGDSFLESARQVGADVYLCADLRHHPALEHLEGGKPYLLNATHWASEWPFVPKCATWLRQHFALENKENTPTVDLGAIPLKVTASRIVTEPWTAHFSTTE